MALTGVLRPGHVSIRVLDMDAARRHYGDVLGLIEMGRDERKKRAFFKGWDEHDHHSVILQESPESGMEFMGWKVDSPATLQSLAAKVEQSGLCTDLEWIPEGELPETGERFRFTIPTGHVFELYAYKKIVGNQCGTDGDDVNPTPWPDGLKGIAPSRFDHCLLYGDDLDGTVKLMTEILGFGIAERVMAGPDRNVLIGAFLSCSNKAHDVAFIRQPVKGRFHHASFLLGSWEQVLRGADILSRNKVSIDIGPTRHGITRGETVYFFDPSGNRNEVFAGGYAYYPDKPPITWHEEELGPAIFYHDRKLNEAFLSVFT